MTDEAPPPAPVPPAPVLPAPVLPEDKRLLSPAMAAAVQWLALAGARLKPEYSGDPPAPRRVLLRVGSHQRSETDRKTAAAIERRGWVDVTGALTPAGRAAWEDHRAALAALPEGERAIRAALGRATPSAGAAAAGAVSATAGGGGGAGGKPRGRGGKGKAPTADTEPGADASPAPPDEAGKTRGGMSRPVGHPADHTDHTDPAASRAAPGGAGGERPEPTDCPVKPLGHDAGTYHFLSPSGELRRVTVRDLSPIGLVSLFGGRTDWMITWFPRMDKDGNPVNDFNARGVATWLILACEKVGIYDPETRIRGAGVWRSGDGAPVVHVGDAVWMHGAWQSPGITVGRDVYPARARVARPAMASPADAAAGAELARALELWRFRNPVDRVLTLGWWGSAFLGGYPKWRVHLQVAAEHGAGKSTLGELFSSALGAQSVTFNDYSEAGLKHFLSGEARVAVLDEAETGGAGGLRVAAVIELIRRMSGGAGASSVRGSPSGQAHTSTVTGCACMLSVNAPPLAPQDRSRIVRVDILKHTGVPGAALTVDEALRRAAALSAGLRARAVQRWDFYAACAARWRAGLLDAGCDGRQSDILSGLLAGRDLLLHDAFPCSDDVEEQVQALRPLISAMRQADREDGDAQQCLMHLLGYVPDHWRSGTRQTLGQMIATALREDDDDAENSAAIRTYGLRVLRIAGQDRRPVVIGLAVANKHPSLGRIYSGDAGRRWSDGGWITSLQRLSEDVVAWERPVRFAGVQSRALLIPAALLPVDDRAEVHADVA